MERNVEPEENRSSASKVSAGYDQILKLLLFHSSLMLRNSVVNLLTFSEIINRFRILIKVGNKRIKQCCFHKGMYNPIQSIFLKWNRIL